MIECPFLPVCDIDTQVQGWSGQPELVVHLDDPINENGTHLTIDIPLHVHVWHWAV